MDVTEETSSTRAVSTTLDTVLFVLLVSAAVAVLGGIETGGGRPSGAVYETADVLGTSTATVTADRRVAAGPDGDVRRVRRSVHGTHAELLATVAATEPRVTGSPLVPRDEPYRRAVANATRRALGRNQSRTAVRAVWSPYPDAPITGEMQVGSDPPPSADVAATALSVPSGYPNVTAEARRAADRDGYEGVARALARGVVRGVFPPNATRAALRSEGPDGVLVRERYSRAASALNASLWGIDGAGDVEQANDRLVTALRIGFERDLRSRYDSPEAAADALQIERVRIVVRRWSR